MSLNLRHALDTLRAGDVINERQHHTLLDLMSGKTLSLYWEIRALFYVGVISAVFGVGLLVRDRIAELGPLSLIAAMTLLSLACWTYCWKKSAPYAAAEQPSPTAAFDYLLYAGCALFATNLATIENQYHLLSDRWDMYVLASALLYSFFAYRFDNRLVLTLALTTLAAWFGVKLQSFGWVRIDTFYPTALAYGAAVLAMGVVLHRMNIKRHFLGTYLNIAVNVLFVALLAGFFSRSWSALYGAGLALLIGASVSYGAKTRRFLYVAYALFYGYIGISGKILPHFRSVPGAMMYLIVSSIAMVVIVVSISRRFKERA